MRTIHRRTLNVFVTAALLLAASLLSTPGAQAQSVREFVRMDSLTVGDTFNYAIRLNRQQSYDAVIFPDSSDFSGPFEIRSRRLYRVNDFRDSLAYEIQFFGTADTTIPRLPVTLVSGEDSTTLYTNPVPVRFRSVLQSPDEGFRPLKPIFDFAAAWWPWFAGLLAGGVACWYLYRLYRRGQREESGEGRAPFRATPFRDPLKELDATLQQLEKVSPEKRKDFEQFYIALGDAIRTYFEELYEIPAMEMTSGEILRALRGDSVDEDLVKATRVVLNEADLVKFANFEPTVAQSRKALEKGFSFHERAREIDAPRIERLRRRHHERMEEARREYEMEAVNKTSPDEAMDSETEKEDR